MPRGEHRSEGGTFESPTAAEIDPSCLLEDDRIICYHCRRCNHDEAEHLDFKLLQRGDLVTARSHCAFRAGDMNKKMSYAFCTLCATYLQRGVITGKIHPSDLTYWWPVYYWQLLSTQGGEFLKEAWALVPRNWRGWWLPIIQLLYPGQGITLEYPQARVRDVTMELREQKKATEELKIDALLKKWKQMVPIVLCPWGCTEYIDDTGEMYFDAMVQRCYPYLELPMTGPGETQLKKCVSARHDFLWNSGYPLFGNPDWKVQACVALIETKGLRLLTCRKCSGGHAKMFLHVPRLPQHLPSARGCQLAHAVLQPRDLRLMSARKHNVIYQMVRQDCGWSGVDTCHVGTAGRFDFVSLIGNISEALAITGRADIRHLLERLVTNGILSQEAAESFKKHAEQLFGKPEDFNSMQYGGTYVTYEDCIRLQYHLDDTRAVTLKFSTGEEVSVRTKWPRHILFVHEHSKHGAWFPVVPPLMLLTPMKKRVRLHTDLMILIATAFSSIPMLWEMLSKSTKHQDDWSGHLLTYLTKQMFSNLTTNTSWSAAMKDPFDGAYKWSVRTAMEFVYDMLEFSYRNIGHEEIRYHEALNLGFFREVEHFIHERLSRDDVLDVCSVKEGDSIGQWDPYCRCAVLVKREGEACDLPLQDRVIVGGQAFELRYIFDPVERNSRPSVIVRHGKQFVSWWQHRDGKIYALRQMQLDECDWTCCIYCAEAVIDYRELRMQLLESLGGQRQLICSRHGVPLIVQQSRKHWKDETGENDRVVPEPRIVCRGRDSICGRHARVMCPQQGCTVGLCERCMAYYEKIDQNIIPVDPLQGHGSTTSHSQASAQNNRAAYLVTQSSLSSDDEISEKGEETDASAEDASSTDEHSDMSSESNTYFDVDTVSDLDVDELPFGRQYPVAANDDDDSYDGTTVEDCVHIPGTLVGDPYDPLDIQMGPRMAPIGARSLLNHAGSMLTRRNRELTPGRIEEHFLQKIVVTSPGQSVPLVHLDAMLFSDVFPFDNSYDGSVIGGIPSALFAGSQQCSRYNVASMHDHAQNRLTLPFTTASTQSRYQCFLYDGICNEKLSTTDTRLIRNRGLFATDIATETLTMKEVNRVFVESMDGRRMVDMLCASQAYDPHNLFLTITANFSHTPGLEHIMKWLQSHEIVERYEFTDAQHEVEIRAGFADAMASLFNRNWDKHMKELLKYVAYSPEQPLGEVSSYFRRKEYQGLVGNVDHSHALLRIKYDEFDPIQLRQFQEKIRGTQINLLMPDDIDRLQRLGVLADSSEWMQVKDLATSILTHRSSDARHQRRTGVGDADLADRVRDSFHLRQSPTDYVTIPIPVKHTKDAWQILLKLGMAREVVNDPCRQFETTHPLLASMRHYAPRRLEDCNMSPTNPDIFAIVRSMSNLQRVGGRSVNAYVCDYVANLDDNVRVYLHAKAKEKSAVTVTTEFLYNNKLKSSSFYNQVREAQKARHWKTSGRAVSRHQMFCQIMEMKEVTTNIIAVTIPTTYYEDRLGTEKREAASKAIERDTLAARLRWYNQQHNRDTISLVIMPDEVRIRLRLPQWRWFTPKQVLTIE